MKLQKLQFGDKKATPKKPGAVAKRSVSVAPQTLAREEDIARQLDLEARKELSLFLAAHPEMVDDPDVRALEEAVTIDVSNRLTPGLQTAQGRLREQRARIAALRARLKTLRQEMADDPLPAPAPPPAFSPLVSGGEHASEYAVLARSAHRAAKKPGPRAWEKVQDGSANPNDDEADNADDDTFDTQNDGVSKTGFH